MDVVIRGQNLKISDAIEKYSQQKLGKLDRYLPNITDIRLDLSRQNTRRGESLTIAQITLRHKRGAILRAEERVRGDDTDAAQAAINAAADKMYRRIERFKGKRQENRRGREKYFATEEELSIAEELPEYEEVPVTETPYEEFDEHMEIVRRKVVELNAMAEQEAIEQMELLGHSFFLFMNRDTGSINVLYRRMSGGYGVLVPEQTGEATR